MKAIVAGCLALAITNAAFEAAVKPPWLWSTEERVQKRLDPNARQQRLAQARFNNAATDSKPGWAPINGRENPELLLPSELLRVLLQTTDMTPAEAARYRAGFRNAILESGWNYDDFWRRMDADADGYVTTEKDINVLYHANRGKIQGRADSMRLAKRACEQAVLTLDRARGDFGDEAFDKFLYTGVAPILQKWTSPDENREALFRMERGCK